MAITATEFKLNLSKYLELAKIEDIFISKNGKIIAKLSNPNADRKELINSLVGIIPSDADTEQILKERIDNI